METFIQFWICFTIQLSKQHILLRNNNQVLKKGHSMRESKVWLSIWYVAWGFVRFFFLSSFIGYFTGRIIELCNLSGNQLQWFKAFSFLDFQIFWWRLCKKRSMSLLTLDLLLCEVLLFIASSDYRTASTTSWTGNLEKYMFFLFLGKICLYALVRYYFVSFSARCCVVNYLKMWEGWHHRNIHTMLIKNPVCITKWHSKGYSFTYRKWICSIKNGIHQFTAKCRTI